jgi:ribonuclease inhibitor
MNVKKVILEFGQPQSVEELHRYLAGALDFPDYYGSNLDALFDSLTDICRDTCIAIHLPEHTAIDSDYLELVCRVFTDAELDNPHLAVLILR